MTVWQILWGSERTLRVFKDQIPEYAKLSHPYALLKKALCCFLTFVSPLSFLCASLAFFEISGDLVSVHSLVFSVEK